MLCQLQAALQHQQTHNFAEFRKISDKVGALLMVDMAHIAGLVAAGVHLLVKTEPTASNTAGLTKFSLAISSICSSWRFASFIKAS